MDKLIGVKRLGYTVLTTLLLFSVVFAFMFLVYFGKTTVSEIGGHLTMLFTLIGGIIGAYLGVQTFTDTKKIDNGGKANDSIN
jgi:hypothetical protein